MTHLASNVPTPLIQQQGPNVMKGRGNKREGPPSFILKPKPIKKFPTQITQPEPSGQWEYGTLNPLRRDEPKGWADSHKNPARAASTNEYD